MLIFIIFFGILSYPNSKSSNKYKKSKINREFNQKKLDLNNYPNFVSFDSVESKNQNKLLDNERFIDDYSNKETSNEQLTLIIDDTVSYDRISNSKFIDCTLNEGETHLFVVKKKFTFEDIEFSFPNTNIGAIKIDCSEKVTITNCKFTGCAVSNGLGSAIFVSPTSQKATEESAFIYEFTGLTITQSQADGFAIYIDNNHQSFLIQGGTFNFNQVTGNCGGIKLINIEKVEISKCTFSNVGNSGAVNYVHNDIDEAYSIDVEECTFTECSGRVVQIDVKTGISDHISLLNNHYERCKKGDSDSIIFGITETSNSILLTAKNNVLQNSQTSGYTVQFSLNASPDNLDPIIFEDNTINFDDANNAGHGILVMQSNRDITIRNCTFKHVFKGGDPYWASTIIADKFRNVVIEDCKFNDCGINNAGNVICIYTQVTKCRIENCNIYFSILGENTCGSAVSSYIDNMQIIGNTFERCNTNSLRIDKGNSGDQFELVNNYFKGCDRGDIIGFINKLSRTPIIQGNIFEKNTNGRAFIFKCDSNVGSIIFENNTFKEHKCNSGGFGGDIDADNKAIDITFLDCKFIDNEQGTNGGGFNCNDNLKQYKITFTGCTFSNNKANGNGGALFLNSNQENTITGCTFEGNSANSREGGAIYVNNQKVTISKCTFSQNKASTGQAICVGNVDAQIIINQESSFISNMNEEVTNDQYMIVLRNADIELANVEFRCPSVNGKQSYPILFESSSQTKANFQNVASHDSPLLVIPSAQTNFVPLSSLSFLNCQGNEFIIQNFNPNFEITDSVIQYDNGATNTFGGIQILSIGSASIINTRFINVNKDSIINYNHANKATSDNSLKIEGCRFENCVGCCCYLSVESESLDSIQINDCTFDSCKKINYKTVAVGASQTSDSISLTVDNCQFNNCGQGQSEVYIFYWEVNKAANDGGELTFNNNKFHFDSLDQACVAFRILQEGKRVTFHNCSFDNSPNSKSSPWETTISANRLSNIDIDQCTFTECGHGGNVIVIESGVSKSTIQNSTIEFASSNQCASGISSYIDNIALIGNRIFRCNENSIRIQCKENNDQFQLIENYFTGCNNGYIIGIYGKFSQEPIIRGNTFEKNQNLWKVSFDIKCNSNVNKIIFEDNTFKEHQSSLGGFGGQISADNGALELDFLNCKFINNEQNSEGGGFQSNNKLNRFKLTFTGCVFTNNIAKGKGGGLTINTNQDVTISGCTFNGNKATDVNENTKGEGGAIYIYENTEQNERRITIQNCHYENNKADNGCSIMSNSKKILNIDSCTFIHTESPLSTNRIDVVTYSSTVLFGYNTIDFSAITEELGLIKIANVGDIKIFDSKFKQVKANGVVSYNANAQGTSSNSFTVEECIFEDCKGVCCYMNIVSGSLEKVNMNLNVFDKCQNNNLDATSIFITQTADSISLDILNNTFSNCPVSRTNTYTLSLTFNRAADGINAILFKDNTISFDDPYKAAQGMFIRQSNREIIIQNCSFKHCFKGGNPYWASSIIAEEVSNIVVEECKFNDCGINNGGNIINIYSTVTKGRVENCYFYHTTNENEKCGSGIATYVDNMAIVGNTFIRCAADTVRIQGKEQGDKLELIDNYFTECARGNIIGLYSKFSQTPTISGNVFEKNQNSGVVMFVFKCNSNVEEMIFENNTFKEHVSKYGGFGGEIHTDRNSIKVTFLNCKFINNEGNKAGGGFNTNDNLNKAVLTFTGCIFSDNRVDGNGGGLLINSPYDVTIEGCEFLRNDCTNGNGGGLYVSSDNSITVSSCIFDDCSGSDARCFSITSKASVTFDNNVIQNMKASGENGYFGSINYPTDTSEFVLNNVSFIDNKCDSLYGGGAGLKLTNSGKILFKDCKFIRNSAVQNTNAQRPVNDGDSSYYNGDGGGIQYGYSEAFYNVDIEFNGCHFEENKAFRHGGAIAIQTLKSVIIKSCTFERNTADSKASNSELLFTNKYNEKAEGRGGAIYLNPTFSHKNQPSGDQNRFMTSVEIDGCTFTSNSAFDGFAIFIEGEDTQTSFSIVQNNFINNYRSDVLTNSPAIITSEICDSSFSVDGILANNNQFSNDVEGISILKSSCAPPTQSPTESPTQSATESPTQSATESPTQSATESPTQSATESPTQSATESPTQSATESPTQSATESPTQSATESPTQSATESPTQSATESPTQSATESPTQSATESPTQSATESPTQSATESPTQSATESPTQSATESPTQSATESPTQSATESPTQSATESPTQSATESPTQSATESPTQSATESPTQSATESPTQSATESPTQSATESPTQSATESPTQSATESPTQSATESPTQSATESPTQSATESPTQSATESPTQSATESPTQSATESPTQSATESPTQSATESPTQSATESPTQSATESPTQSATESPTQSATESPTQSATESPTQSATESPTQSATESPTQSATESPTQSATESPTQSATESPTQSATESPTQSATESPTQSATESPTQSATESPTQSATESPTQSATESPTQSATESPSMTPLPSATPQRTYYPGTVNTYINRNITDGSEIPTGQIQGGQDNIKQISGCRFSNIGAPNNRNYYIQIHSEVLFYDNIFENDVNPTGDSAGVLWQNYNGRFTITNCKFIRIASKMSNGFVINTNYNSGTANNLEMIIEKSEFIDCGKQGVNKPLIDALNDRGILKFYECNFTFSSSDMTFNILQTNNNGALFEGCRFTRCGDNTIKLGTGSASNPEGTFTFKNNYITMNEGRFIQADKLRSQPIIENNIFESITLTNKYLISISHNQGMIELDNNTFSQITSNGETNCDCGGSSISLTSSNSDYTIRYNNCKFNTNINNHENAPNNHGGAIQTGFSSNSEANFELISCEFINNNVKGGHGGGVAIRTSKTIKIENCKFEDNTANNEGDTSGSKGFGGAIYISTSFTSNDEDKCSTSVIIKGCTLNNNKGYQGYGIYLQGQINCDTTITINDQNEFNNNVGIVPHQTGGCIIASEIISISEEEIEESNSFGETGEIKHFLYVDSFGNELPDPTETPTETPTESPSQSPTESPSMTPLPSATPQRTYYPGTVNTYINRNITDGSEIPTGQIQGGQDNIKQISGCRFSNIGAPNNRNYYIQIHSEVLFYDNIFENDANPTGDSAGVLWQNYNGRFTITNCKFIRIASKMSNGFVINTNYNSGTANNLEMIIEKSEFIDCGKQGVNKPLIDALNDRGILKFYECNFTFSSSDMTFNILQTNNNGALFEGCRFTRCGDNTIKLGTGSASNPEGTFTFKNNYITMNEGRFIQADKLRSQPIIENNIFESITLTNKYLISISHNQGMIELDNNTFSQITSNGETNCDCGGSSISLTSSNSDYTIRYNNCKFNTNINNHENAPNNHGGAIQIGFSSNSEANFELISCEFINNNVKGGHGGGVAIRTSKTIKIENCKFEDNTANNEGDTSGSKGFGGAIYISTSFTSNDEDKCSTSVIIKGCTLNNNKGYQGYGIYLQGQINCDTTITINDQNEFNNNVGIVPHQTGGCIIASEIISISEEEIEESNSFGETGEIKHFLYVDSFGNELPDPTETPTETPTESPSQSPTESPTQSATESPTQSATESPTQSVTESPTQSATESPTQSATESPTQSATESPTQSATESPTQSATESPTQSATESPTQSAAESPSETPTELVTQSPTEHVTEQVTQPPTKSEDLPDIIVVNPEDTTDNRYELIVNDSSLVQVHINVSNFTGIDNTGNGGAIHLVNTSLECENVNFSSCTTTQGGGGAIYIDNTYETKNPITLINLSFTECKAEYGGAVYIHCSSKKDKVLIMYCIFTSNLANGVEGSGKKFGGSAIYLSARKGRLKSNNFIDNNGDITVKIVNDFDDENKDKLSLLEVSECDFKAAKDSKNSLYYLRGNHGSKLQLNDCTFSGDLKQGSHHIDGKEIAENSPKLMIKNCLISDDDRKTSSSLSLLSEDMKSQILTNEKSSHDERMESLSKTWKIVTIPIVALILVSFAIIYIIKKSSSDQDEEEEEEDIGMQNDTFVL